MAYNTAKQMSDGIWAPPGFYDIEKFELALDMAYEQIARHRAAGNLRGALAEDESLFGQAAHVLHPGFYVYAIKLSENSGEGKHIKIGLSRRLKYRMNAIQTSCPLPICEALYIPTPGKKAAFKLEQSILKAADSMRYQGEWLYAPDADARAKVSSCVAESVRKCKVEHSRWYRFMPGRNDDDEIISQVSESWKSVLVRIGLLEEGAELPAIWPVKKSMTAFLDR